jgi:hydrogenase expression/formation protein HypD
LELKSDRKNDIGLLHTLADRVGDVRIMEFCGGHTHALVRSGLLSMLPKSIKMIHGPGCPVCVLPPNHLQAVIDLLMENPRLTALVYGDVLRIPTLGGDSLLQARGRGLPIKMIYSPLEIIKIAESQPDRDFLFLAIGFETTAPGTAILLQKLREKNLKNVSVLCLHVLTPPAVHAVMEGLEENLRPQALIGPGHVSLVTGTELYPAIAKQYSVPIVISGFDGNDLIQSISLCLQSLSNKTFEVINQYTRALKTLQQAPHQKLMSDVFQTRDSFSWRGLGNLPHSALMLNGDWSDWDAEKKYALQYREVPEHPACQCSEILRARKSPKDCRLFGKACTPSRPFGACMVSSEGACSAYYQAAH